MCTLNTTDAFSGAFCATFTAVWGDAPVLMTSIVAAFAFACARKLSHCFSSSDVSGCCEGPAKKAGALIGEGEKTKVNSSVPGVSSSLMKFAFRIESDGKVKSVPLPTSFVFRPDMAPGCADRKIVGAFFAPGPMMYRYPLSLGEK